MSAPYPQQPSTGERRSFELKEVLVMVAGGAGAVGYLLGFFDDGVGALMGSMAGVGLISTAALAGMRFLPKTPDALFVGVPLTAYAALALLQDVIRNTASGLVPLLMVLALAQLAAVLGVLLIEGGVIKPGAKPGGSHPGTGPQPYGRPPFSQGRPGPSRPGPGWNPQGQQPAGQPAGQFGGQPPWNPAAGGPSGPQPDGRNPSSDGFAAPNPDNSGPHQVRPTSGPLPQNGHPGSPAQAQPGQGQGQPIQGQGQPGQGQGQPGQGQNAQPSQGQPGQGQPGQGQPGQGQNAQPQNQQQPKPDQDNGGPQGTRQMPHPNATPPTF
ncbi:DUF5336 domain-containing protein [Saccharopolyspora flava]|uniref:Uncharacterized protein n=1 Tax=Saccharopolyspora flava TaxID=95161 RepID=A0A1I6PQC8_9PSEU|nr:DUF5336 domain-containing protein [Saccharopolyspora flava]SFS42407.1 hypothetical protein SAMN05660874_01008 [Saccharopolyspora flava]